MKKFFILVVLLTFGKLSAQNDLTNLLDSLDKPKTDYASATFKATRIVTGHSVETMKEGQLEFRIAHRFGRLNTGINNFFGIDQAIVCLDFEYGVTDWLELGYARTPMEKTYQGFTKIKLLRQSTGEKNMPFTMTYFGAFDINTAPWDNPDRENLFSSRLTYVNQLMFARKFNENFSFQLSPTLIHRNLVPTAQDHNDLFAMGFGARYKLSKRVSVNAEYYYVLRPTWNQSTQYCNPISVGFDIETGGHVFQIMLANSQGMIEKHYIADNMDDWRKGDIHLGFNISRVFSIY